MKKKTYAYVSDLGVQATYTKLWCFMYVHKRASQTQEESRENT